MIDEEIRAITVATTPNIAFYVGAIALALIAPHVAAVSYLVIAVWPILRARGENPLEAA